MMADELERRVRTLEEELNGERHVSRYSVEQAGRTSEVLHTVRAEVSAVAARVDVLAGDMASVKAALGMHGRALDVLMQDVRQLRSGQDAINVRLDHMEARLDRMEARLDGMEARLERVDARLDGMDTRLATMERNIVSILAAVMPGSPPPA